MNDTNPVIRDRFGNPTNDTMTTLALNRKRHLAKLRAAARERRAAVRKQHEQKAFVALLAGKNGGSL